MRLYLADFCRPIEFDRRSESCAMTAAASHRQTLEEIRGLPEPPRFDRERARNFTKRLLRERP